MTYKQSTRSKVIERRTYNRPLNAEGTVFESTDAMLDRVIGHQYWLWERAAGGGFNSEAALVELDKLRKVMADKEMSVSGRTLWLGGTAVSKRREASQFNPARRSTKFVSDAGVVSFTDFGHGDTVKVLTHEGNWKNAVVSNVGEREMLEITFSKGRYTQVEYFTREHTWIKVDGSRTSDIMVGDKILPAPNLFYDWEFDSAPASEQSWWCYGYVYGDGALDQYGNSRVRLCGSDKDYLDRFNTCGFKHSFPPSCNDDPIVYTGKYKKTLPDLNKVDTNMLTAFIAGYLAADGSKKNIHGITKYVSIQATSSDAQDFIEKAFPMIGIYITRKEKVSDVTNFGKRSNVTFRYGLSISSSKRVNPYVVDKVVSVGYEDAWCLTVEDDHSFVLPNGIVTGNCAYNSVQTVHDCVDAFWLLLNGCGKGFKPVVGTLNGFSNYIDKVEIVPSTRLEADGREDNYERFNPRTGVWRISIGDSAEAWAKSFGKLLAGKYPAKKLVLDFSEIRPAGQRLAGYGWMCVGDALLSTAFENIANLLNRRAGQLLSAIDIMDVINWIGTALSSRRSAEITLMDAEHPEINEFISAKKDYWVDNIQRAQSNNSIVFYKKPTKAELSKIFGKIIEAGGSEPGFINGEAALKRAPWFKGVNPCAEILLGDKNFCNLVEVDVGKFNGRFDELLKVIELAARANYRQTCVNLDDGILQRSWHEGNEFLRLCGVGVTGVVKWEYANDAEAWRVLRSFAVNAANSMADELKMPRSKAVTTVKPSGTLSKVMDTTEGVHKPLGKYIFNNVNFNVHDKIVDKLRAANYNVFASPVDKANVIVTFPVAYEDVEFDVVDGIEVNLESAVEQLERYKMLMENYVDHNCSITVSYSVDEVPEIVGWLVKNWDTYVGVSWLFRNDPTKTAEDLGYLYLPQEVVSKERYDEYVGTLLPVYLDQGGAGEIDDADCASGVCPVR